MITIERNDYIKYYVSPVMKRKDRNRYMFRVILTYPDGTKKTKQSEYFKTKAEAESSRRETYGRLASGTYIIQNRVRLSDIMDNYLDNVKENTESINTLRAYRNASKHILPMLGNKNISEINSGDIQRLYKKVSAEYKSESRLVKVVMNGVMDYAVSKGLLVNNPAKGVRLLKKGTPSNPYHTRNIDTAHTLTLEQVQTLIEASKDTPIHMQVLFNVLMGLRRSEINALKYSDVDFLNQTLSISAQLGQTLHKDAESESRAKRGRKTLSDKDELKLKTKSSARTIPIPNYVFEAIQAERKTYEKNRSRRRAYVKSGDEAREARDTGEKIYFQDDGYICCSTLGKPRGKSFHYKYYKQLLKDCGFPNIRWHDLRSTYTTLLLKGDVSPKAVSESLGHADEIITIDVYGDNRNLIPEDIPELLDFMAEVLPKKRMNESNEVLDAGIDISEYLPA